MKKKKKSIPQKPRKEKKNEKKFAKQFSRYCVT